MNGAKLNDDFAYEVLSVVEQFAEMLFSLMLSALVRQNFDPSTVLEVVRRAIY